MIATKFGSARAMIVMIIAMTANISISVNPSVPADPFRCFHAPNMITSLSLARDSLDSLCGKPTGASVTGQRPFNV